MRILIILIGLFICTVLSAQDRDFIGGPGETGISVTASHTFAGTDPSSTINGHGLDADLMAASRFLFQAGLGGSMEDIERLTLSGDYEAWIDEQAAMPMTDVLSNVIAINEEEFQYFITQTDAEGNPNRPENYFGPWFKHFSYAWWDNVAKAPDQLRYKVANALSQLFVVSHNNTDLGNHGEAMGAYYDLLLRRSFGNFRDLLGDVTFSPSMGFYLSHLNNPKTDPTRNQEPDENFAREIMQLFTIGLNELNMDGSLKLDNSGQAIPTYDNSDIRGLARVFTGLGGGDLNDKIKMEYPNARIEFGTELYGIDRTIPMQMYDSEHEPGEKNIVGDYTIPAGQSGLQDIQEALDHLFNHPNVPPFISRQLIQRMVKSNPSPAYIERVANVFVDNGQGVRGDLLAVIKAILLDQEARSCEFILDPAQGQLREPLLRHTHIIHALPNDSPSGNFWKDPQSLFDRTKQAPQTSPTVFNFYNPNFTPAGEISEQGLVAPEFGILDSETSIGYANQVFEWTFFELLLFDWEDRTPHVEVVFDELEQLARMDQEGLIHRVDVLFLHGQMSDVTRSVIRRALSAAGPTGRYRERAQFVVYMAMISPDYTIIK